MVLFGSGRIVHYGCFGDDSACCGPGGGVNVSAGAAFGPRATERGLPSPSSSRSEDFEVLELSGAIIRVCRRIYFLDLFFHVFHWLIVP